MVSAGASFTQRIISPFSVFPKSSNRVLNFHSMLLKSPNRMPQCRSNYRNSSSKMSSVYLLFLIICKCKQLLVFTRKAPQQITILPAAHNHHVIKVISRGLPKSLQKIIEVLNCRLAELPTYCRRPQEIIEVLHNRLPKFFSPKRWSKYPD